jgi:hypothetical protein
MALALYHGCLIITIATDAYEDSTIFHAFLSPFYALKW